MFRGFFLPDTVEHEYPAACSPLADYPVPESGTGCKFDPDILGMRSQCPIIRSGISIMPYFVYILPEELKSLSGFFFYE
jgi:hypothetical protein